MGSVIVANWVSLDGVMQGPGAADEDTRDGFTQGGWAAPYAHESTGAAMGEFMAGGFAWLFGRRSYEGMLGAWNERGGPFRDGLNNTEKYVASGDPHWQPPWPRTTVLSGDITSAVAELKTATDDNLVVMGSGILIRSLMSADLVDRYLLFIAPLVLGRGRRLFADGAQATLRLVDCHTAPTGIVIASYETGR